MYHGLFFVVLASWFNLFEAESGNLEVSSAFI